MAFSLEKTWQHKANVALTTASALDLGRDFMRQLKRALMGEGSWQNQTLGSISPTGGWVMQRSCDGTTAGTDATQATGQIQLAGSSGTVGATINGVLVTVIWGTSDTATATALASAITSSNAAAYVTAVASTTNVNLTAKNPGYVGAAGNAITLVQSGTGVAVSGATLTGGVDPDGVDRLGDVLANYVQASEGTAHAWAVFRSAGATYAGGYLYVVLNLTATNSYGLHVSKTFPTGGSTTAAPTSAAADAASYTAQQYWEGATTNQHYASFAMATDGAIFWQFTKGGSGVVSYLSWITDIADAKSVDTTPWAVAATYVVAGVGTTDSTIGGATNFSTAGNTILKGRNAANTAANVLALSIYSNSAGSLHAGTLNLADAADGQDDITSPLVTGITQATAKGRIKDLNIAVRARSDGSTYNSSGSTTVLGSVCGDLVIPANQAQTV